MNLSRQIPTPRSLDGHALSAAHVDRPWSDNRVLLGNRVDVTSYEQVRSMLRDWVTERRRGYICVASVHSLMEAHDDPLFKAILNEADLVTPDGMPLVWGLRLLGARHATRVYGPDLTDRICSWAASNNVPVGFHGSTREVLDRLIANLTEMYPELHVVYHHSPPFRPLSAHERQQEIDAVRASGARILFVGLGCPKQERWMADHVADLDVVMFGVGAAFDYLAGTVRRPPHFVQRMGLEWLFRLVHEPRRLWRRYLRHNPRFLYLFTRELIGTRLIGERL